MVVTTFMGIREDHVFFRSNGFQHVEDGAVSDMSAYLS